MVHQVLKKPNSYCQNTLDLSLISKLFWFSPVRVLDMRHVTDQVALQLKRSGRAWQKLRASENIPLTEHDWPMTVIHVRLHSSPAQLRQK